MSEIQKVKSYTGARIDLLKMVRPPVNCILDVGCSNGANEPLLRTSHPNASIEGIELDSSFVIEARERLDQLHEIDLDNTAQVASLKGGWDCLIFGDVLEHTKHPKIVLGHLVKLAASDAQILISLPNVQHWYTIFCLLKGVWPENDRGIFDKTHLRWFTKNSIENLALEAGLKISELHRKYRLIESPGGRLNRLSKYFRFMPFKPFFTFQYLVKCKKVAE